jgi:hypothetical protein
MTTRGDDLRHLVQVKLPHARVFWDPPPDKFFETKACELVAINQKDESKRGSILYKDGIVEHPAEALAEDFVTHIGPKVADIEG